MLKNQRDRTHYLYADQASKPYERNKIRTYGTKSKELTMVMKRLCQLISIIFSPIFTYMYGVLWILMVSDFSRINVIGAILSFIQVVLFVFALYYFIKKEVTFTLDLQPKLDRIIVYALSVTGLLLLYLWCELLGISIYNLLIVAGIIVLMVDAVVTIFWKISAHASVFAGVATIVVYFSPFIFTGVALLLIAICYARVYLKSHTIAQVVAGACLGITASALITYLSTHW